MTNASLGKDNYRISWLGSGDDNYTTYGNLAALDVLNAMFVIAPRYVAISLHTHEPVAQHRAVTLLMSRQRTIRGLIILPHRGVCHPELA